jgi:hypothetical protein
LSLVKLNVEFGIVKFQFVGFAVFLEWTDLSFLSLADRDAGDKLCFFDGNREVFPILGKAIPVISVTLARVLLIKNKDR